MGITEYEIANKNASYCSIEFVDDDALFYGGELARVHFAKLYPELEPL